MDGLIGSGGMGVVVSAHHLALDKRVAIKLMRPELRASTGLVRRFLREGRAAARLRSRHVTHVLDVGTLEDGAPYIVMEHLDGVDLAAWIRKHGPASTMLAAAIVAQACDAIAEAHAAGIVHRDLKPSNLFVTSGRDGALLVKVLDFGISKFAGSGDLCETATKSELGTPAYAAPEQLDSPRSADPRSDLWSLGVILYELVTGSTPFRGASAAELRSRVRCSPVPPIDRADVPDMLVAIVARCLAKDPAARFQTAAELATALCPLATDATAAGGTVPPARQPARRRSGRWSLPAIAIACAATAAVAARSARRVPPAPAPSPIAGPRADAPISSAGDVAVFTDAMGHGVPRTPTPAEAAPLAAHVTAPRTVPLLPATGVVRPRAAAPRSGSRSAAARLPHELSERAADPSRLVAVPALISTEARGDRDQRASEDAPPARTGAARAPVDPLATPY